MNIRRKRLSSAFVVALALIAISASAASADEYHHEAEEPARFVATNEGAHVFTLGLVGTLSCNTATFTGTEYVTSPQKEVELDSAFSGCTFLGVSGVTINMNGCKFRLGIPKPINLVEWEISLSLVCPIGKKITFTVSGCTIEIGAQGGLKLGIVGNLITKRIRIRPQVTGLTYTASVLCPGASGTHSNGTYEGVAIASGETEFEEIVGAYVK